MTMSATGTAPTAMVGGGIIGFIGVVIFSGSLPATRMAVQQNSISYFSPSRVP
jgi:uncharacterized membrane protein YgdD (TMEM256/DUF423 family)